MKKRAVKFKLGRLTIFDDERSGHPKTTVSEEVIRKTIHNVVLNDRRVRVREVADISIHNAPVRTSSAVVACAVLIRFSRQILFPVLEMKEWFAGKRFT